MAFSWTEDVSVGDPIDAADVNEIKTNLDSIYTDLSLDRTGCTGAGWTELPVSAGDSITNAQFQEMRDVTDYADDNKCSAENGTYNSGVYSNQDSGYNGTHYGTHDSDDDYNYKTTAYISINSTNLASEH